MRWLFAILLPPVAVLMCYRPISAILNAVLCLLLWFPGVIHACLVVSQFYADQRNKKLGKVMAGAINQQTAVIQAHAAAQAARQAVPPVLPPARR